MDKFDEIISTIREGLPDVRAIYLFGSFVSGETRPDSDIDIAIVAQKKILPKDIFAVSVNISELLACDVDLVDLNNVGDVLAFQVVTKGKRLWGNDQNHELFETQVMSRYLDYVDDTQELKNDIVARGFVYGA